LNICSPNLTLSNESKAIIINKIENLFLNQSYPLKGEDSLKISLSRTPEAREPNTITSIFKKNLFFF